MMSSTVSGSAAGHAPRRLTGGGAATGRGAGGQGKSLDGGVCGRRIPPWRRPLCTVLTPTMQRKLRARRVGGVFHLRMGNPMPLFYLRLEVFSA